VAPGLRNQPGWAFSFTWIPGGAVRLTQGSMNVSVANSRKKQPENAERFPFSKETSRFWLPASKNRGAPFLM